MFAVVAVVVGVTAAVAGDDAGEVPAVAVAAGLAAGEAGVDAKEEEPREAGVDAEGAEPGGVLDDDGDAEEELDRRDVDSRAMARSPRAMASAGEMMMKGRGDDPRDGSPGNDDEMQLAGVVVSRPAAPRGSRGGSEEVDLVCCRRRCSCG